MKLPGGATCSRRGGGGVRCPPRAGRPPRRPAEAPPPTRGAGHPRRPPPQAPPEPVRAARPAAGPLRGLLPSKVRHEPAGCGCSWLRSSCPIDFQAQKSMKLLVKDLSRGGRVPPVKPSTQPTLVRTQHLPPPAKTAPELRSSRRWGRLLVVPPCCIACRRGAPCRSGCGHMADRSGPGKRLRAPPVLGAGWPGAAVRRPRAAPRSAHQHQRNGGRARADARASPYTDARASTAAGRAALVRNAATRWP
jgi:hypothetical protein